MQQKQHLAIGLTGLIGSGKSTCCEIFASLDAQIIDTDKIAQQLTTNNGLAVAQIKKIFGDKFLTDDLSLNRIQMREYVFNDAAKLKQLENILHPLILEQVKLQLGQTKAKYSIIAVPLLFRAPSFLALMSRNIFVDCPEDILIERIICRNQMTREQILTIIKNQVPRTEQLELADDIILNDNGMNKLYQQVVELNQFYLNLASK